MLRDCSKASSPTQTGDVAMTLGSEFSRYPRHGAAFASHAGLLQGSSCYVRKAPCQGGTLQLLSGGSLHSAALTIAVLLDFKVCWRLHEL